jgi:hypothetical protein
MLHKCANPSCSAPFRSLREGKLFLAETLPCGSSLTFSGSPPTIRRREHFWLCQACSAEFTLRLDPKRGMLTVPIAEYAPPRFLTQAIGQRL